MCTYNYAYVPFMLMQAEKTMKGLVYLIVSTSLLLLSLLHITTCTVYTVTPDDHYYPNTTCHHCHNLQHYLLNITKYFTSNTQLLFLPGLHHLHTHLIIQNVHNISLIGSTTNGTTLDTVIIQCKSSVGIVMANITNLVMKYMIIRDCMTTRSSHVGITKFKEHDVQCVILLFSCFKVHMQCTEIYNTKLKTGLLAYNILESFTLSKISSKGIRIVYTDDYIKSPKHTTLNINQFKLIARKTESLSNKSSENKTTNSSNKFVIPLIWWYDYVLYDVMKKCPGITFGIKLELLQTLYAVSAVISNSTFKNLHTNHHLDLNMHFLHIELNGCNNNFQNIIIIQHYNFVNNKLSNMDTLIACSSESCKTKLTKRDVIKMLKCNFINNTIATTVSPFIERTTPYICAKIWISESLFQTDFLPFLHLSSTISRLSILVIDNCKFEYIMTKNVIHLANVQLILIGPVIFCNIVASKLIMTNSDITIHNYLEYSYVTGSSLVSVEAHSTINLMDSAYVNITNNDLNGTLFQLESSDAYSYPLCRFQYYKEQIKGKSKFSVTKSPLVLIAPNNNVSEVFNDNIRNINCKWNLKSLYYCKSNPLEVYGHTLHVQSARKNYKFDTGLLCHCFNETQPNCFTNILRPLFPGQNIKLYLALNSKVANQSSIPIAVKIYDENFSQHSLCIVKSMSEAEQMVNRNCTKLVYNIFSENQPQCKLLLYNIEYKFPTIYYIKLLECPAGFELDNVTKGCDCDQKLKLHGVAESCDINDQTILRPVNSWISATTHNNSYTYHVSLHCPFHYCLPHPSHLNFSTPNSQCQFNRSGLLCGHCQQGLSTVFSSYYCQHCSNFYIWLIIPIAVAGLIMVLLLFYLNLTVSDGSINAFVLYMNIISINIPVFFSSINNFTPAYTFISLANLDLGIQTCFYNGMDDYAKMWLQLAFPFYLIFIATLIIITSRYCTTIQRLTARRALPVLATLFLLSYTKILRIVSSVLFFYSTITHLPSKHTTLVWSVDASVPVLGVKFTVLYIFCIVLFCMLIPFNIILVFTKTLSRFNLVNKFMPLIDAYRGPYEYELYYWTGFQLLVRSVFFGISALSRNINLTLGIVLISVIIGTHGIMWPYKHTAQNVQELLYLFNLQALYTISLYGQDTTNITAVNILIVIAAVQFSIIFIYHIITYMCDGVIRKKIQLTVDSLREYISRSPDQQQYELGDNFSCTIPEVTYNYQEYREPLICQD